MNLSIRLLVPLVAFVFGVLAPAAAKAAPEGKETVCDDGVDNDGDMVVDCGDHDCATDPKCQPDGSPENTEARCSDWVDNDENGHTDCDDTNCPNTTFCKGSWDLKGVPPSNAGSTGGGGGTTTAAGSGGGSTTIPTELAEGQTEEDLIGTHGDADGERNNVFCSDGVDNDNDGQIDCADLGCRLDPQITVCQSSGDFRFSAVARVAQDFVFKDDSQLAYDNAGKELPGQHIQHFDTTFDVLQLRVLGQLPFIQNSFFLLSMRAEKTPRLTFALFQVPLGKRGHYININSGGGGLSLELVRSVSKRLLVDSAYYVYNAFEQGNGAAIEVGGPVDKHGKILFRTFFAGGSGRFTGNIGGRFFPDNEQRYTYSIGSQLWFNALGYYTRWDSPFLYTPVPLTLAIAIGGKYDQRVQERYPALNLQTTFRWKRFIFVGEAYGKRELEFKNFQLGYNGQVGLLAVKRRLLFVGDFGQYLATTFQNPPAVLLTDLKRQLRELQYRVGAHVYLWRNVFFATLIWRDRRVETGKPQGIQKMQDLRLLFTYRF